MERQSNYNFNPNNFYTELLPYKSRLDKRYIDDIIRKNMKIIPN